jgi:hypothetical protein
MVERDENQRSFSLVYSPFEIYEMENERANDSHKSTISPSPMVVSGRESEPSEQFNDMHAQV